MDFYLRFFSSIKNIYLKTNGCERQSLINFRLNKENLEIKIDYSKKNIHCSHHRKSDENVWLSMLIAEILWHALLWKCRRC